MNIVVMSCQCIPLFHKMHSSKQDKKKTKTFIWSSGWMFLKRSAELTHQNVELADLNEQAEKIPMYDAVDGAVEVKKSEDEKLLKKYREMPRRGAICEMNIAERLGLPRVLRRSIHIQSISKYGLV
ncbi:uncharacterized protein LOC130654015 isoform X1 [Hydractinia symbiolongicarpus]|uniref:uncharacterized protein LOC130654015 isoform X1 n=1 Tax=Hydractinia symbiolongicarpus TaxID=13093 RepID=UPI00254F91E3|nr:uncharacterized protein LOC130654015 isoform X1 [Hydractinia symbiolongicarpus]